MKKSKLLVSVILVLALSVSLFALAGCSGSSDKGSASDPTDAPAGNPTDDANPATDAPVDTNGDGEYVIGISVATATNNPHIAAVCKTLEEALQAQGWTTILQDADNDAAKQSVQFDNLLTQEVDLIVYWAHDADAAVADVKKAEEAGIPVVSYFADASEEAQEYIECYVGANQLIIANAVADYMHEQLGGSGNVVIINGKEGKTDFVLRSQGFRERLEELGDYTILAEEYSDSDRTQCQTIMENYLTAYPEINGVFTTSDDFGVGAYNAISSAGVEGISICSIDGQQEVLSLIKEGAWSSTVYQTPAMMAEKCVEVVKQVLAGTFTGSYEQFTDYYIVTAENVDDYLN